jgi:clan AA aspartic protease (TIGR02281 family)
MGSTSRFFILIAVLIIGAAVGGQAVFSRIPLDQILLKTHLRLTTSGQVTAGSEDTVIPLERLAGVWVARVELNDLHDARLIVDTGATFTTISEDLAFNAGVQTDSANPHINLFTAGGKVQAEMGVARRIRVGNAGRDDVKVVVHTIPNLPDGIDGLLGLSFFDRFLVRLDQSNQQLHLSPRN